MDEVYVYLTKQPLLQTRLTWTHSWLVQISNMSVVNAFFSNMRQPHTCW